MVYKDNIWAGHYNIVLSLIERDKKFHGFCGAWLFLKQEKAFCRRLFVFFLLILYKPAGGRKIFHFPFFQSKHLCQKHLPAQKYPNTKKQPQRKTWLCSFLSF